MKVLYNLMIRYRFWRQRAMIMKIWHDEPRTALFWISLNRSNEQKALK